MTTVAEQVRDIEAEHILQTYKRFPPVFVRGQGSYIFDTEGKEYLDMLSGLGVVSLGHAHLGLAQAISTQTKELVHTSNLFFHLLQGQVATRLAKLSKLPRAFLCNSGTEAIEACLKFSRRYWHTNGKPTRKGIVAFQRSFHGRTFGSLSVTSGTPFREPFEPLLPDVTFVSPEDPTELERAISTNTAALIIEPIQGEGGVWPISQTMADTIQSICTNTGTLLIADEIQCGLGRTGHPFYYSELGLQPDLIAIGKALGAGFPVGAALISEPVAKTIAFGDHGSTYGGNLIACRAALVFLDELENGLISRVAEAGSRLQAGLHSLAKTYSVINDIRGAGLIWGMDVEPNIAEQIVPAALNHGLIINLTAKHVIRFLPPLTITNADLDEGLARLNSVFEDVKTQTK